MIDTRVDAAHPALAGQAVETRSLVEGGKREAADDHGTAVAALLAGKAESDTPGLLPKARLLAAGVFFRDRSTAAADAFAIARGIDWMVDRRVDAVNLSLAGPANAILERFVRVANAAGVPLIAAAGNQGPSAPPGYPAAYPGVIAVTAVDARHRVYGRAGRGAHLAFAAPGVRLWTAGSNEKGRFRSGTSYAAPFVTATIAAMRIKSPASPPATHLEAIAAGALDLGDIGRDHVFGWGLVQARNACQ